MACECNIAGLLSVNYDGIISAALNGSTEVSVATDGTVLLGATNNTLSISAYAFVPGGDRFLGVSCPASANAEVRWIRKYDCITETHYFIPVSGGKASITGGPIEGIVLECDPDVVSKSFSASASSGPVTPYLIGERRDGYYLKYIGTPIAIESASPSSYEIRLGDITMTAYLQSFSLTVNPPSSATVSYSFVIPGQVL